MIHVNDLGSLPAVLREIGVQTGVQDQRPGATALSVLSYENAMTAARTVGISNMIELTASPTRAGHGALAKRARFQARIRRAAAHLDLSLAAEIEGALHEAGATSNDKDEDSSSFHPWAAAAAESGLLPKLRRIQDASCSCAASVSAHDKIEEIAMKVVDDDRRMRSIEHVLERQRSLSIHHERKTDIRGFWVEEHLGLLSRRVAELENAHVSHCSTPARIHVFRVAALATPREDVTRVQDPMRKSRGQKIIKRQKRTGSQVTRLAQPLQTISRAQASPARR